MSFCVCGLYMGIIVFMRFGIFGYFCFLGGIRDISFFLSSYIVFVFSGVDGFYYLFGRFWIFFYLEFRFFYRIREALVFFIRIIRM